MCNKGFFGSEQCDRFIQRKNKIIAIVILSLNKEMTLLYVDYINVLYICLRVSIFWNILHCKVLRNNI